MLLQNTKYQVDTKPLCYSLFNRGNEIIYFTEVSQISNRMLISNKISIEKYEQENPTIDMAKTGKRIHDASIYTSKKISLKFLFLSDIFLFPFVRQ